MIALDIDRGHAARYAERSRACKETAIKPSISIVIPAYNEEHTLEGVVTRAQSALEQVTDDWEIVVLDDASTDRTPAIVETLSIELKGRLKSHRHPANRGIAATFEELYKLAAKDWVMLLSGDGQYPPEALADAVRLTGEFDVIVCNRTTKPYGAYRSLISWGYRALPRLLFGVEMFDTGSIKLVHRRVIAEIPISSRSVFAEAERLIRAARAGFRIGKIDIEQQARISGRARGAAPQTVLRAVGDMLALWWKR